MSYILEALKKAQAERQLGNAPTIHAPAPVHTVDVNRSNRKPVIAGVAAGALVVALGALFLLRQPMMEPAAPALQLAGAPATAPVPAPAPAPVSAPAPVAASAAAPVAESIAVPAAPPAVAAPPRPPEASAPAKPAEPVKSVKSVKPAAPPARGVDKAPEPAPRAEPSEAAPESPRPVLVAAAPAAASGEESVGPLQSLPEAVQREVPKVAFGGYIYSPNPAERLLLVDKMLRREGEEVAPGLVLERLLPKAAIMNFRGYRYRVGY